MTIELYFYLYGNKGWISDTIRANKNHEEWISIDLNNSSEINRVVLYPIYRPDLNMELAGFPLGFKIQISNDGMVWETVKEEVNYPKPEIYKAQVFDFRRCEARFVRILGTNLQRNKYKEGNLYRMALSQIEVYNTQFKN